MPHEDSELSAIVRGLIEDVLGRAVPPIHFDTPFASLGMDSALAVELATKLGSALGRSLSPVLVYTHPTVAALCAALAGVDQTSRSDQSASSRSAPSHDPIAIVGLACRFAGAPGLAEFWDLLESGRDPLGTIPSSRPDAEVWDGLPLSVRSGGFLDDVARFEPEFFGIPAREAGQFDPQQRLLLEVCWEALESAGIRPSSLRGTRAAVYIGALASDYEHAALARGWSSFSTHSAPGRQRGVVASRLSYTLGLMGPSMQLDTACASSHTALHLATRALRAGETDLALVGGVNLMLWPDTSLTMYRLGGLSPTGRSRAFDASADGFVRAEGSGLLVLRRLSDALAAGDHVWCLVRGTAINHGGTTNGITAPSPAGQVAVIRDAWADAGADPHSAVYIETHGTGTRLGDPIEATALGEVVGRGRPADAPVLLGSVKTNIGHAEAAAGVAGVIKTALAMDRGRIPANLHFVEPNPLIPFAELGLEVVDSPRPWPTEGDLAGVSSFGFAGANAHVVLERRQPSPGRLVTFTAPSPEALEQRVEALLDTWLTEPANSRSWPADAFDSSATARLSVRARELDELQAELAAWRAGEPIGDEREVQRWEGRGTPPPVAFLFAGLAQDWPGMARSLLEEEPEFRAIVERCDRVARRLGHPILAALSAPEMPSDVPLLSSSLVVFDMALAQLWRSWGVEPVAVVGHSIGEIGAAWFAGALALEEAVRVAVAYASCAVEVTGNTGLVHVSATATEVEPLLEPWVGRLSIAIDEGPGVIIGGENTALAELMPELVDRGLRPRPSPSPLAPHSPPMAKQLPAFRAVLGHVEAGPCEIPLVAALTGEPIEGSRLDASYWVAQVGSQIRLADALRCLESFGVEAVVQLSGHPLHGYAIRACVPSLRGPEWALASLRRGHGRPWALYASLGQLRAAGVAPRPEAAPAPAFLALSAASPASLRGLAQAWAQRLEHAREPLVDLAYSAAIGREQHRHRLAVRARSRGEARRALQAWLAGEQPPTAEQTGPIDAPPPVAFVFSGQGARWTGVALELRARDPIFRAALGRCDLALRQVAGWSAIEAIESGEGQDPSRTERVQPCVWAVQVALAARWRSLGIEPVAIVGQSLGEIAAACVAGALSLEDGARVVAERSRLMATDECLGVTALIDLDVESLRPWLAGREDIAIAGDTGPQTSLVAGGAQGMTRLLEELETAGVGLRRLGVRVALHSPRVDAASRRLEAALASVSPRPASLPLWSTMSATRVDGGELDASWWRKNMRDPMQLTATLDGMVASGVAAFLEIGPHPVLGPPLRDALARAGRPLVVAGSLRRGRDDLESLVHGASQLWAAGVSITWRELWPAASRARELPSYTWDRRAYWLPGEALAERSVSTSLLGRPSSLASDPSVQIHEGLIGPDNPRWLAGHQVRGRVVVPGTAWVELALRALGTLDGTVSELVFHKAAVVDGPRTLQIVLRPDPDGPHTFQIASRPTNPTEGPWTTHASGRVEADSSNVADTLDDIVLGEWEGREPVPAASVYAQLAERGLEYSGPFQAIERLWRDRQRARATLDIDVNADDSVRAATLDACLQVLASLEQGEDARLPVGIDRVRVSGALTGALEVTADYGGPDGSGRVRARNADRQVVVAIDGLRLQAQFDGPPPSRWAYLPRWVDAPIESPSAGLAEDLAERLLVLGAADESGPQPAAKALVEALVSAKVDAVLTTEDELSSKLDAARPAYLVLLADDLHAEASLRLALALAQQLEGRARLLLVTRGAVDAGTAPTNPDGAVLWGFGRTLRMEDPLAFGGLVDLDPDGDSDSDAAAILASVCEQGEDAIAWRRGQPLVQRLIPLSLPPARTLRIRPGATYLVTGGLGGLGLLVAARLVERGARRLILVSRSGLPPRAQWNDAALVDNPRVDAVRRLERAGATVLAPRVDVGDPEALRALLRELARDWPPIRGVVHAAGITRDRALVHTRWTDAEAVIRPKITAARVLATIPELDFLSLFSSAAGTLGSPGQATYAAANAWLDAFAHVLRERGIPATSYVWGSWAEVGLARDLTERFAARGIHSIPTAQGIDLFERLHGEHPVIAILPVDWPKMIAADGGEVPPLLRELVGDDPGEADADPGARAASLGDGLGDGLGELSLTEWLIHTCARVLRVAPERIPPTASLNSLGIDSLLAIELRNAIQSGLNLTLPLSAFFGDATLGKLAETLKERAEQAEQAEQGSDQPTHSKAGDRAPNDGLPEARGEASPGSPKAGLPHIAPSAAGAPDQSKRPLVPIVSSASSAVELMDRVAALAVQGEVSGHRLVELALDRATALSHAEHGHRLAVLVQDLRELDAHSPTVEALQQRHGMPHSDPRLAWLFPGQGAQNVGVLRELAATYPVVAEAVAELLELLELPDLLEGRDFDRIGFAEPALFTFGYSLSRLWDSWGVQPDVVLGHSIGEVTAACVAGVFSLPDACRLIRARARLLDALPAGGAMISVATSLTQVEPLLSPGISIAAIDGPHQVVLAGEESELMRVVIALAQVGIRARRLPLSHALQSPRVDPALAEYRTVLEQLDLREPNIPLISNVHGRLVGPEVSTPNHWLAQLREPVQLEASAKTLDRASLLMEIGPRASLAGLVCACIPNGDSVPCALSIDGKRAPADSLRSAACCAFEAGVNINWHLVFEGLSPAARG